MQTCIRVHRWLRVSDSWYSDLLPAWCESWSGCREVWGSARQHQNHYSQHWHDNFKWKPDAYPEFFFFNLMIDSGEPRVNSLKAWGWVSKVLNGLKRPLVWALMGWVVASLCHSFLCVLSHSFCETKQVNSLWHAHTHTHTNTHTHRAVGFAVACDATTSMERCWFAVTQHTHTHMHTQTHAHTQAVIFLCCCSEN